MIKEFRKVFEPYYLNRIDGRKFDEFSDLEEQTGSKEEERQENLAKFYSKLKTSVNARRYLKFKHEDLKRLLNKLGVEVRQSQRNLFTADWLQKIEILIEFLHELDELYSTRFMSEPLSDAPISEPVLGSEPLLSERLNDFRDFLLFDKEPSENTLELFKLIHDKYAEFSKTNL